MLLQIAFRIITPTNRPLQHSGEHRLRILFVLCDGRRGAIDETKKDRGGLWWRDPKTNLADQSFVQTPLIGNGHVVL